MNLSESRYILKIESKICTIRAEHEIPPRNFEPDFQFPLQSGFGGGVVCGWQYVQSTLNCHVLLNFSAQFWR